MQKIDDFDWDYLYAKAEEYIKEFIPEAHVNHGTMTLHGANPIVDVSFPEKGNKKVIKYLLEQKCIQYRRGTNTKGTRIRNLGVHIFRRWKDPVYRKMVSSSFLKKEKNERKNRNGRFTTRTKGKNIELYDKIISVIGILLSVS